MNPTYFDLCKVRCSENKYAPCKFLEISVRRFSNQKLTATKSGIYLQSPTISKEKF